MKLGFSTLGCPDWTRRQIAEFAAKYGFDGVELRCHEDGCHVSPDATGLELDELKSLFAGTGPDIFAVAAYSRFTSPDEEERATQVEAAIKAINVAHELEADFVRFFGGRLAEGATVDDAIACAAPALRQVAEHAAAKNVCIAIETHDNFCAAEDLVRMIDIADHEKLCVLWDLHHPLRLAGEDIDTTAGLVKGRLGYCHVKDAFTDVEGERHIVMVGAGDVPNDEMIARLAADGFDGYLSFEWEKKWHPELPEPDVAFGQYIFKMRRILEDL